MFPLKYGYFHTLGTFSPLVNPSTWDQNLSGAMFPCTTLSISSGDNDNYYINKVNTVMYMLC